MSSGFNANALFIAVLVFGILAVCLGYFIVGLRKRPLLSGRTVEYIMIAYLAVLIFSAALLYALPESRLAERTPVNENIFRGGYSKIYDDIANGKPEKLKNSYKTSRYEFEYTGSNLTLKKDLDKNYPSIRVERIDRKDGKIEAFIFSEKTIAYGVDLTEKIPLPDIKLKDNELIISQKNITKYKYITFKNDYTASQFIGKSADGRYDFSVWSGPQCIYLRIPKDLKIGGDTTNLSYVNAENKAE